MDDGGDAGFSLGMWVRFTPIPTNVTLLSKWGASGNREWTWDISASDKMELFLSDGSAGAFPVRRGSSFKQLYQRDLTFAAEVARVMVLVTEDIEAELHRRAVTGWDEPVYQKGERVMDTDSDGKPVKASIRKFSDNLLLARARAVLPQYRDKKLLDVVHSGSIAHTTGHLQISSSDLAALNPEQRTALTGILHTIQAARREDGDVPAIEYQPAEILDADFTEIDDGNTLACLERVEASE